MTAQLPSINEKIYRLANHIAGAKGGLPAEWQDWAEEIETDLRALLAAHEQEPVGIVHGVAQTLDGSSFVAMVECKTRLSDGTELFSHPAPVPAVPDEMRQWIDDVVEYLNGGLEADGELEAEGSIEAKRLLARHAAMLNGGKS